MHTKKKAVPAVGDIISLHSYEHKEKSTMSSTSKMKILDFSIYELFRCDPTVAMNKWIKVVRGTDGATGYVPGNYFKRIVGAAMASHSFVPPDSSSKKYLKLDKNEFIWLIGQPKGKWYTGYYDGRHGLVPGNYIKMLSKEDILERMHGSSMSVTTKAAEDLVVEKKKSMKLMKPG